MTNYTVFANNSQTGTQFTFAMAVLADTDGDGLPDNESVTGLEVDLDDDNDGVLDEKELECGSDPSDNSDIAKVDENGACIKDSLNSNDDEDEGGLPDWCCWLLLLLLLLLLFLFWRNRETVVLLGPEPEHTTSQPKFVSGAGTREEPFVLKPVKALAPGSTVKTKEAISITDMTPEIRVELSDLDEENNAKRFRMFEIGSGSKEPGYLLEADEEGKLRIRLVFDDTEDPTYAGGAFEGLIKLGKASVYFAWSVEVKQDKRKMNEIRKQKEAEEKAAKEAAAAEDNETMEKAQIIAEATGRTVEAIVEDLEDDGIVNLSNESDEQAEAEAKAAEEKAAKEAEKKAKAEADKKAKEEAAAAAAAKKAEEEAAAAAAAKKAEEEAKKAKAAEEKAAKEAEKKAKAEADKKAKEEAAAAAAAKKAEEEAKKKAKAEADKKAKEEAAAAKKAEEEAKKAAAATKPASKEEKKKAELKRVMERSKSIDFKVLGTAKASEKDDLQVIKGIGPFIEEKLNALGIYTYLQISKMTAKLEDQVNEAIEFFPGRVKRDQWVNQAKILLGEDVKLDEKALKQAEELERVAAKAEKIDFATLGVASASEKDDLKAIKGIGPFIEEKLNALGIYTFEQVSKMTAKIEEEVNVAIEFFPGRVKRDEWAKQAKTLHKDKK